MKRPGGQRKTLQIEDTLWGIDVCKKGLTRKHEGTPHTVAKSQGHARELHSDETHDSDLCRELDEDGATISLFN